MADLHPRLTAAAARRIIRITSGAAQSQMVRLEVIGGGCSGYSYRFGFADAAEPDDVVIEADGARLLIDQVSLPFLHGAEIDFVDDIIGSSFRVNNPNAASGCGCGTSFSL
jgi:iron-sulfur cluster assembly accessory protein